MQGIVWVYVYLLPPGAVSLPEVRTRACGGWPAGTALCAHLPEPIRDGENDMI